MAVLVEPADVAVVTVACANGQFPSVGALHPPAIRLERAIQDLYGLQPRGAHRHAAVARSRILGCPAPARRPQRSAADAPALSVPADRGRGSASDSGRSGACGHHRARPFPFHRQRRNCCSIGRAAWLCAQGYRVADDRRFAREGRAARRPHVRRQHGRLCAGLFPCRGSRAGHRRTASRPLSARADGRVGAARQSFR